MHYNKMKLDLNNNTWIDNIKISQISRTEKTLKLLPLPIIIAFKNFYLKLKNSKCTFYNVLYII